MDTTRICFSGVCIILTTAIAFGVLDGDRLWPDDMPIADSYPYGTRYKYSAVSDGAGGVITAWEDQTEHPEEYRIKAQRLNSEGQRMWNPPDGIFVSSKLASFAPAAVSDDAGGVIIAWSHHDTGAYGVYCQRLNADGQPQWAGDVRVSTAAASPVICKDGNGGAVIGFGRRVAHVNSSGVVTAPGIDGIEVIPAGFGDSFSLTDGIGNSFYAAWASSDGNVYARRLDGPLPWGPTPTLVSAHDMACSVSVAAASDSGVLICWWARDGIFPGRTTIRAQSLTSTGSARWPSGGVVVLDSDIVGGDWYAWSSYFGQSTAIARDAAGGCFAAWMDYRLATSTTLDTAVFAQRVDSTGLIRWGQNGAYLADVQKEFTGGRSRQPVLLPDGWGGVIATFESLHWNWPYEYNYAVYATHLNRGGIQLWHDWISYDNYGRDQNRPQSVYDASGSAPTGAIITWATASESLYVAKVHINHVPRNDLCAGAQWISPGSYNGTTRYAGCDGQTTCGNSNTTPDVWYRYRPDYSMKAAVDTCTADFDTVLSIHTGCPGTADNTIVCNDDCVDSYFGCSGTNRSCIRFDAFADVNYYIRVSGWNGNSGDFTLTLTEDGLLNDDCANAIDISEGIVPFSTVGATTDGPDEPTDCDFYGYSQIDSDIWYRYTARCSGLATISLCDSEYDTKLAVYSQTCPPSSGQSIVCNDDACGTRSSVALYVTGGKEYLIRIGDGYTHRQGAGVLEISFTPAEMTFDCMVDLADLAVLSRWWLAQSCAAPTWCGCADINRNAVVNLADVIVLSENWLIPFDIIAYEELNAAAIAQMVEYMSGESITSRDGSEFNKGACFVYKTSHGRLGKFIIQNRDARRNSLTIAWTTYNQEGLVYSSGTGAVISSGNYFDLDLGKDATDNPSIRDFRWLVSSGVCYLIPSNSAIFKPLYYVP